MLEVKANLWTIPCEVRVITTNGSITKAGLAVLGRGCALEAKRKYPNLPKQLADRLRREGNHVYAFEPNLLTFPVKHQWYEAADLCLIRSSAEELVDMTTTFGWHRVAMPRPGSGNGRRDWTNVKPILEPMLDDRFIVCSFSHEN